jgi:hypothetical protein
VVSNGEIGREDLGEVTPLGEEDHDERAHHDPACAIVGDDHLLVLVPVLGCDERGCRARGEDQRDDQVHDPMPGVLKRPTPILTAIATCTTNAPAAPSHTESGRPRDDITNDANIVLSGQFADEDGREDRRDDRQVHHYSMGVTADAWPAEANRRGVPIVAVGHVGAMSETDDVADHACHGAAHAEPRAAGWLSCTRPG